MKSTSAAISLPRTNRQGGLLQLDILSATGAGSFSEPVGLNTVIIARAVGGRGGPELIPCLSKWNLRVVKLGLGQAVL